MKVFLIFLIVGFVGIAFTYVDWAYGVDCPSTDIAESLSIFEVIDFKEQTIHDIGYFSRCTSIDMQNMRLDPNQTLVMSFNNLKLGNLTIILPNALLDNMTNSHDDLKVWINGTEIPIDTIEMLDSTTEITFEIHNGNQYALVGISNGTISNSSCIKDSMTLLQNIRGDYVCINITSVLPLIERNYLDLSDLPENIINYIMVVYASQ